MRITVNHLTRMRSPYVCVAGVDANGRNIRPILAGGRLPRSVLMSEGGPFRLGAVVDVGDPRPQPVAPEVEDVVFNPRRTRVVDHLTDNEFLELLDEVVAHSLRFVFGPAIVKQSRTAAAVPQSSGTASLGVLRVTEARITVETRYEKPDIRVHFTDPVFGDLAIKVTDLRLWEHDQVMPAADNIEMIEDTLDDVYLAVGLTRAFAVSSYEGIWHWLQINNVFPVGNPLWTRE